MFVHQWLLLVAVQLVNNKSTTLFVQSINSFIYFNKLCFFFLLKFNFRNNGPYRNRRILILFNRSIRPVVFAIIKDWIKLGEIFYQSAVIADEWIFGRSLHLCIILDIFIWNGSCLLNINFIYFCLLQNKHSRNSS